MSRQKIPLHLRKAIWYAYDSKSGYEGVPIPFTKMEIDHIIPERVTLNPRKPDEFQKWKEKYNLSNDFNIQGIENLCPSTREFNLRKSDKGLYDESGAYDGHIIRALTRAAELNPNIEHLKDKFKEDLDKRNTKKIIDVLNLIKEEKIGLEFLIAEGLQVNFDDLKELENRERYNEILAKYRTEGPKYYNFGEYFEIMSALRYAVSYKREEADFWIDLFKDFLSNVYDVQVKKRVFYERTYAMFKCEKSWEPIEVEILEYFKSMNAERNLEILRQGATLFGIFCGEFEGGRIKSSGETISDVRKNLIKNLQVNIDNAITDVRRANLSYSKFIIESRYSIEEYELMKEEDITTVRNWLDNFFILLNNLISYLENINYFDFDEFYSTFVGYSDRLILLKDHPDYDETLRRVSNLKNNYEGVNSTVPDLMKRAIELFDQKKYLKAIKQFHGVKNVSFNPKHLFTCILSIYHLGLCYERLGLLYASKYYFLVAYHMAVETDCEYNTKQFAYALGIDSVALVCFDLGSINETIYYTTLSLMLRDALSLTPIDYSTVLNRRVIVLLAYILYTLLYEKEKFKNRYDFTQKLLEIFDLWDLVENPLDKWEQEITEENLLEFERAHGMPFKYPEGERSYSWYQLGTNWTIKWDNKYVDTTLSEEFIAYLQIYLSSLSEIDFIPSGDITLKIIPSNQFNINYSDEVSIIELPTEINSDYFHRLFSIYLIILNFHMIISREQIMQEIGPLFEQGYFLNYYREIFNTLVPPELFSLFNQDIGDENQ